MTRWHWTMIGHHFWRYDDTRCGVYVDISHPGDIVILSKKISDIVTCGQSYPMDFELVPGE